MNLQGEGINGNNKGVHNLSKEGKVKRNVFAGPVGGEQRSCEVANCHPRVVEQRNTTKVVEKG